MMSRPRQKNLVKCIGVVISTAPNFFIKLDDGLSNSSKITRRKFKK